MCLLRSQPANPYLCCLSTSSDVHSTNRLVGPHVLFVARSLSIQQPGSPNCFNDGMGALTIILGWNINPPNLDQTMTLNTASSNGLFQPLRRTNMDSRLVATNHCLKRHCLEWKEEISVVMNSKCLASLKLFLHRASANSLNFNPPIGAKPTA